MKCLKVRVLSVSSLYKVTSKNISLLHDTNRSALVKLQVSAIFLFFSSQQIFKYIWATTIIPLCCHKTQESSNSSLKPPGYSVCKWCIQNGSPRRGFISPFPSSYQGRNYFDAYSYCYSCAWRSSTYNTTHQVLDHMCRATSDFIFDFQFFARVRL